MKFNWPTKQLSEISYINPRESIGKGIVVKKVPMDKLQPFCRDIPEFVFEEYNGGTKFRNDDTIMARITPCLENGKIAKVSILSSGEIGFGSTEYIVFRAIDGVSDADFLYYLICSPFVRDPAIKSMVGSSGRQRVQTDVVANIDIELPPIEEQEKIGRLLKTFDDKIKLNNEINNNLPPHPCNARIAAKQRRQIPKPDGCLHTDDKVSDRGSNEETAKQFSNLLAA